MFSRFKNWISIHGDPALKNTTQYVEQFLFPLKCLKCGVYLNSETIEPHTLETCFCDQCMTAGFYHMNPPFCTKCGGKFHNNFTKNHVCETCLKIPLKLDRVRAAAEYKGLVKDAIPFFKYHSKLSLAKVFEPLLFEIFLSQYAGLRFDLIMPIPLHKKKLKQRGFNQAFVLVRNFGKLYQQRFGQAPSWKIDIRSLERIKHTPPQTGFDIEERKNNLKNAFKVIRPDRVENKSILLIDDVFTTGATCNEAAGALLIKGAQRICALVLARA